MSSVCYFPAYYFHKDFSIALKVNLGCIATSKCEDVEEVEFSLSRVVSLEWHKEWWEKEEFCNLLPRPFFHLFLSTEKLKKRGREFGRENSEKRVVYHEVIHRT